MALQELRVYARQEDRPAVFQLAESFSKAYGTAIAEDLVGPEALFKRFRGKCFRTGRSLDIRERGTWAIDHILPSPYLYPLSVENAALLSREANNAKAGSWPSHFYTNNELIEVSASRLGAFAGRARDRAGDRRRIDPARVDRRRTVA